MERERERFLERGVERGLARGWGTFRGEYKESLRVMGTERDVGKENERQREVKRETQGV